MKDNIKKVLECRLCGSKHLEKVIELTKNPVGDRFYRDRNVALGCELHNVEVMLCRNCGQMQLSEVVEPKEIYTDEYLYTTGTSVGLPEHFAKSAQDLMKCFAIPKDSLVVEIGSNEGAMLAVFKNQGMRVLGIDPAGIAVKKAKDRGVDTIEGFFSLELAKNIVRERGRAKLVIANNVIANNVIANIPALLDIIQGIKEILADDGVFVFETSYAYDVIRKHLIDTIYHEHISYFSAKPLGRLFAKCGLELFDAENIWTKGGSLRGYVAKPLSFEKTERLKNLVEKEESFIFASHIVANSENLNALFQEIQSLLGERDEFIFESFYAKAVLEKNLLDMVFAEHLNYLYLLPLCEFLEKKGLNLYDAKLVESKGGSIQISISRNLDKPKTERLLKLLKEEQGLFNNGNIFMQFAQNLLEFRERVRAFALGIKERQGKLVVYGSSVGGLMMVYHLGMSDLIDCFVDDNPAKIGAYCPSLGIPVYDSKILEEDSNIKEVISVAWRFMDSITQRHQEFLKDGGKFYSLELPTLSIVEYKDEN